MQQNGGGKPYPPDDPRFADSGFEQILVESDFLNGFNPANAVCLDLFRGNEEPMMAGKSKCRLLALFHLVDLMMAGQTCLAPWG
jgi:hypothetical protein